MDAIKRHLREQSDLILVLGMIGILIVLFTPIPSQMLDFLLIANLSFALLILLLTFYVDKPLQFSTFPSILLIATLFRLSLNIAATRLVLGDAYAGEVIDAVGNYVIGGNYVMGMIVFLVLVVVQYVVVTNGAQRVAEVAARFTLDGMPGKQMSIDADLNMGLINEQQAQERRNNIEKEANFYGAMDGASKFVKGDAIAGIIIILIDIIGGLIIGIAQMGMEWSEALHRFTLLTIGDGIVTQIPALVIATGTGIIVTRAASDEALSQAVSSQVTKYPKILILIGLALTTLILLPGIPAIPVFLVLVVIAVLAYYSLRAKRAQPVEQDELSTESPEQDLYGMLAVDPIEIQVGQNLVPLFGGDDSLFMERIAAFRKQYAMEQGFVVPKVRVKDYKQVAPQTYEIHLYGAKVGSGDIHSDCLLAINPGNLNTPLEGIQTKDPSYGLPAVWVGDEEVSKAREAGYTLVEPAMVLMTHLSEIVRQQSSSLLTRSETEQLIERVKESDPGLVEELIPGVMTYTDIQKILQNLLSEKVSIRNMSLILEALVDYGKHSKDFEHLTELVRQKLGPLICQSLASKDGDLHVLLLDPSIERTLSVGVRSENEQSRLTIDPNMSQQILTKIASSVENMMQSNLMPVLLCAPELRRHLRHYTERVMPHLSVLSMSEIPHAINVKSFGMVSL
ncbi:flagellar biosynthesis protein FlhA [Candidatus Thiodiazotropha endoloripes]|uniref:flagellar biosynthesis protein FlhA n=1 Tax=Candidatus Thiodiazotropha endoloripes TaxID=1818881 RepID=UPI00083E43BC|nr:flagellar biosynthesis protein FlhA [Candidatus Thiodiazotropha endoloripes]ODB85648.1 flagellar biosynthesis protein FlhA [Candidatus Thiodiazotropha endoloripes]